jgi:hypothetical protein
LQAQTARLQQGKVDARRQDPGHARSIVRLKTVDLATAVCLHVGEVGVLP